MCQSGGHGVVHGTTKMNPILGGRREIISPSVGDISATQADSDEKLVAALLYQRTKYYCYKFAPAGAKFEYKYPKSEVVLALADENDPMIAMLLQTEYLNKSSTILWGDVSLDMIDGAIVHAEESGSMPGYDALIRIRNNMIAGAGGMA